MRARLAIGFAFALSPNVLFAATFGGQETVAPGVSTVSSNAASAIAYDGVDWHLAYEAGGDIFLASRDAGTWSSAAVSTDAAAQRNPKAVHSEGAIVVAWEDDRSGHSEIYVRRVVDGVFDAEICLSCDTVASRSVTIAAHQQDQSTDEVLVAWVDETSPTTIRAASYDGGAWDASVLVSNASGDADEPSAFATDPQFIPNLGVVWTDEHDGEFRLVTRQVESGFFNSEVVLPTNQFSWFGGPFSRPTAATGLCCKIEETLYLTVYENGFWHYVELLGQAGGGSGYDFNQGATVASGTRDGAASATVAHGSSGCFDGFSGSYVGVAAQLYTDAFNLHRYFDPLGGETVFGPGLDDALFDVVRPDLDGYTHRGRVLVAFIAEISGTPTLVAHDGELDTGKVGVFDPYPASLLIAPQSVPTNTARLTDAYSGDPFVGRTLNFSIDPALEGSVNLVSYPTSATTDSDGVAMIGLEGGGCAAPGSGWARLACFESPAQYWSSIKSPDIDGDCIVDAADLAYVEGFVGSADFCADIDDSGIVDADDVAIVELTLGDMCSVVGTAETQSVVARHVRVAPNPVRTLALVRVELDVRERARVTIVDVQGRRVREFGELEFSAGANHLTWDVRDGSGRTAAPGRYFVVVTPTASGGERLVEEVLVVR